MSKRRSSVAVEAPEAPEAPKERDARVRKRGKAADPAPMPSKPSILEVKKAAAVSPEAEECALAECARVRGLKGDVPPAIVSSLLHSCTPALASPDVAREFCKIITRLCGPSAANRAACGDCGVIPAVISVLSSHGIVVEEIAVISIRALSFLASEKMAANALCIVSADGLPAVYGCMESHPVSARVQRDACLALLNIAESSSDAVAAMKRGRAVELLTQAKRNHPKDGEVHVKVWADRALALLK